VSSPPVPSVREAIAEGGTSVRCVGAFRFLIVRLHGEQAAASWAGDDERTALWGIDAERHGGQRWLHQVRREHAQGGRPALPHDGVQWKREGRRQGHPRGRPGAQAAALTAVLTRWRVRI
jgi:hypothetical protein